MLTIAYFMQTTDNIFANASSHLNKEGIIKAFHHCLTKTRTHILNTKMHASCGGCYEDMCYNFHVGTMLLMSFFDGRAVYVEKTIAQPPSQRNIVYWHDESTFLDPKFSTLKTIRDNTNNYIIRGGIDTHALRNFSKHYIPCLSISTSLGDGPQDIHFHINKERVTGPILKGLVFPLFNDAVHAYRELCRLMGGTQLPDVDMLS